ncbi:hypothetical protein K9M74_05620 [Candidatus Woesearchaeota archaeon]|nr:hypothetical protein [Candidatus Woesearchaeota archaeon]
MFVGIDESNHGWFPEIFVGSYSPSTDNLVRGNFPKKRIKKRNQTKNYARKFANIPYVHTIFSETSKNIIGKVNIPVVAICELARYVNGVSPVDTIFVDGELLLEQVETIERLIYDFNKSTKLHAEPRLDKKIRLVNEADNRANHFHHYYSSHPDKGTRMDKYVDNLITPRLEAYKPYLIPCEELDQ